MRSSFCWTWDVRCPEPELNLQLRPTVTDTFRQVCCKCSATSTASLRHAVEDAPLGKLRFNAHGDAEASSCDPTPAPSLLFSGYIYISPESLNTSELVTLLKPLKDTLEDLYLELEGEDDNNEEDLIDSLAHFTALKRLDTNVDVWRMLSDTTVPEKY
jgi:hypothetical protein